MIVDVYRNLRPGYGLPCWSIAEPSTGRVLGHAAALELADLRFRTVGQKTIARGELVAASPTLSHPSMSGDRGRSTLRRDRLGLCSALPPLVLATLPLVPGAEWQELSYGGGDLGEIAVRGRAGILRGYLLPPES